MCGRVVQEWPSHVVATLFDAVDLARTPGGRYNVAPTQSLLAVVEHGEQRVLTTHRWGLVPTWAKDARIGQKMINARAETIQEKPSFRTVFRRQRSIVPVSAFYEWQRQGESKVPHAVVRRDGQPLALAAIWSTWRDPEREEMLTTGAIVTTSANELMAPLHDRMPVVLGEADWARWLDPTEQDPAALAEMLKPCPDDWLVAYPVSRLVNNVRNDDSSLVAPLKAA